MKRCRDRLWHTGVTNFLLCLVLSAVVGGLGAEPARAAEIHVTIGTEFNVFNGCSLRGAIFNHNHPGHAGDIRCEPGDGADTITISTEANNGDPIRRIILNQPLPPITGILTITLDPALKNNCVQVVESAYLTVAKGATVGLDGIGFDANGSFQRSVIENDGGNLSIFGTHNGPCRFSNEKRGEPVVSGGILVNRFNGATHIAGATFADSAARPFHGQSSKGGAINLDSGTVTIDDSDSDGFQFGFPNTFSNDTADEGGAIYVNTGATLNIASNNFLFTENRAGDSGGAIYNNGGTVHITRGGERPPLKNVSFVHNIVEHNDGGAIYSLGGSLTIDGAVFISNESLRERGGAIAIAGVNPVTITGSLFDTNKASIDGGAIFLTNGSIANFSGDTFTFDRAGARGGLVYANDGSQLKFLNNTFFGGFREISDGLFVLDGIAEITFSTIGESALSGKPGSITVSNSLLDSDGCDAAVVDGGLNLQSESSGCPASIPTAKLKLDPRRLWDNGGPTPTIALQSGSPAIDAIPLSGCTDQEQNPIQMDERGYIRPWPMIGGKCDIGAFEFGSMPAPGGAISNLPPRIRRRVRRRRRR